MPVNIAKLLNLIKSCFGWLVMGCGISSCQTGVPHTPKPMGGSQLAQHLAERSALIVTLPASETQKLLSDLKISGKASWSLSSATPVSPEGHFLTNAHCLEVQKPGDESVILYSPGKWQRRGVITLIWKDDRMDLALVKAPFATPHYYSWTPRNHPVPKDTLVVHGGVATGPDQQVGSLLAPVRGSGQRRPVRHSLRLKPGDSGGPLLLPSGELLGINRAVGYLGVMDTSFFTESHSIRPDPARITSRISETSKR